MNRVIIMDSEGRIGPRPKVLWIQKDELTASKSFVDPQGRIGPRPKVLDFRTRCVTPLAIYQEKTDFVTSEHEHI